ncbi:MAG: zinc finger domain-containing protein [Candidatus Bathyarchaeota archaeon]|nr:zinc finger domain-containing protein [Candidatus Bathyarchaeota archaeon]
MSSTNKPTTALQTPICTSCNRTISPGAKATKFTCPDCGEIVIWRCEKCRQFGRYYSCPKCGFKGP